MTRPCRRRSTRFNGAPTSRSGIALGPLPLRIGNGGLQRSPDLAVGDRRGRGRNPARGRRFNGAPTSRSGIGGPLREVRGREDASTEPRPRGRGSGGPAVGPEWRDAASTEPRPRGRGSLAPFTMGALTVGLQRSPDLAVGDRHVQGRDLSGVGLASTEPRPRGRGSVACRVHRELSLLASTEPRPRGRGSRRDQPHGVPHGRASTEPRPRGRGSHPPLRAGPRPDPCFNGAPTSRSGIVAGLLRSAAGRGASTEPRPRGRGSHLFVLPSTAEQSASTEPRPRGRGSWPAT